MPRSSLKPLTDLDGTVAIPAPPLSGYGASHRTIEAGAESAPQSDAMTDTSFAYDGLTGDLVARSTLYQLGRGHVRERVATIDAVYDPSGMRRATVATAAAHAWGTPMPDGLAVFDSDHAIRVNALLAGTGAPPLQRYGSDKRLVLRAPGHPSPLPVRFTVYRSPDDTWYTTTDVALAVAGSHALDDDSLGCCPKRVPLDDKWRPVGGAVAPQPAIVAPPMGAVVPLPAPLPAPSTVDPEGLFRYPDRATTASVITSELNDRALDTVWARHLETGRGSIALVGPAGTGKTSLIEALAARAGVGVFTFDASAATGFSDWTGTTQLQSDDDGTMRTTFAVSAFLRAIKRDNSPYTGASRIVEVGELTRAAPAALNVLLPIMSEGRVFVPDANGGEGMTVDVDPAVLFAFTMNRGHEYTGTSTLDLALRDRVGTWLRTDYLSQADEGRLLMERTGIDQDSAVLLVRVAQQVRDIAKRGEINASVSTRRVLDAAHMVVAGLSLRQAAEVCIANAYPDDGGVEGERGLVCVTIYASLPEEQQDDRP